MIHYLYYRLLLIICCPLVPAAVFAQEHIVTAGVEYKPIFPIGFLRTGTQEVVDEGVKYDFSLQSGFNAGMVIRKGLTQLLSLEMGISYVKRKYGLTITDTSHTESSQFRIIGYEIPVSLVVYIRLGENVFMNASMGVSPDMFASNVQSVGDNHQSVTARRATIQPAVLANIGWELRTEKIGFFYLGASFHGPFQDEFVSHVSYLRSSADVRNIYTGLSGNYLTADLRYFFPPEKKVKK